MDRIKIKIIIWVFTLSIFPSMISGQQFSTIISSLIPSGTLGGEFVSQGLNISQILTDYQNGTITYSQANSQFQTNMTQIFSSIGVNANGLLANTAASIDSVLTNDFAAFVNAFSTYYGQAILLSTHLSYPVGYDQIEKFPSVVIGFGGGTAFANVDAIKSSLTGDSAAMFDKLSILPTLGISLNVGVAFSEKWSLRLSIFPNSSISLPTSAAQLADYNISFNYGAYRARVSYVLLDDNKLGPGISLSAFAGYTNGNLTVQTMNTTLSAITDTYTSPIDFTVSATPSYNAEAVCTWSDFTVGPEIRLWLNLNFFIPYIGYGIGFQYSQITTTFNFNTNILLEETALATLYDGNTMYSSNSEILSSVSSISDQSQGSYYLNRIIIGVELKIFMVRLNGEVVFDPVSSIMGLSFGFNTAF